MDRILAIDPGPEFSAFVRTDSEARQVYEHGKIPTLDLLAKVRSERPGRDHLAIEMVQFFGMAVGQSIFNTCMVVGRLVEAWGGPFCFVFRKDVKLHLCGSNRAKDANIRAAVLERWGGKEQAVGRKASPGPLYGVKADVWSSLAVAITYADGGASEDLVDPFTGPVDKVAAHLQSLENEALRFMSRVDEMRRSL